MKTRTHLLIIDPQNDFCDPNGSLFVPGADQDIKRLARMIQRLNTKLDDIHVTLDSHRKVDISHPIWWRSVSSRGNPAPFTLITAEDAMKGKWDTAHRSLRDRSIAYLQSLESSGRYTHTIWPEHCLIGDWGHNVSPELASAVHEWESQYFAVADFVTKGSNPWTEHFSAVKAEVPDPSDPETQINTRLIETLEKADSILLAGEASTHCLLNTVADIADSFSDVSYIKKLVWLTDATSPVPDPPGTTLFSDKFRYVFAALKAKGMKLATTEDFLR